MGFRFFAVTSATDAFVCSFDADLCGWSNDQNNWRHAWLLTNLAETLVDLTTQKKSINQALCLSGKIDDKRSLHSRGRAITSSRNQRSSVDTSDSIQARLWSPQFLREDMIQCLTFNYRIDQAPHSSVNLALMQRQEG